MTLLQDASDTLSEHGFSVSGPFTDEHGTIGLGLERGGERYCLVAKEYAYRGMASFIEKVATFAVTSNCWSIFYAKDSDEFTVFSPAELGTYGAVSFGNSKKSLTEWRELSLDYGIQLEDHLNGEQWSSDSGQTSLTAF